MKKEDLERVKKEDLERRFKHGEIISLEEKRERMREEKEIPLTFKHVKLIDTPEFEDLKDVEFFELIKGDPDEKDFERSSNEITNPAVLSHLEGFKHKLLEESQYHCKAFLTQPRPPTTSCSTATASSSSGS